jgi:hypothetical protein
MSRGRRLLGTFIAAAALVALVPATASALSFSGVTAAPTNTQAGAHSDLNIHVGFSGGSSIKNLVIALPPGEVGDPNAAPFCSVSALNAHSCPANTAVGTASSSVTVLGLVPAVASGTVYNVEPHPGEPARFGIVLSALPITLPGLGDVLLPPIVLQAGVQLRQTDYGLSTVVEGVPNQVVVLALGGNPLISVPITVSALDQTLKGIAPGTGKPFLRNPTSCTPHAVSFSGVAHDGSTLAATAPAFTPTGCGSLDFSPSFSARIGGKGVNGPKRVKTNATTSIDQDATEGGLLKAQVQVPPNDLVPDTNLLGSTCDPASFQAGGCPANTIVGSAVAASPLLTQPLSGPVALVNNGGIVPDIGLDLNGQLHLQLRGTLTLSELVTFDGLPDIPISHFALSFPQDPGFLMANRDLCAQPHPVFHADFNGYNGAATSVNATATVDGCGGTAGKCRKGKAKRKRGHKADAGAAKKHKKKSCKKKRHKKRR